MIEAQAVLEFMHDAGFEHPVVAGGFLRDRLLGLPPKDIDVFVSESEWLSIGGSLLFGDVVFNQRTFKRVISADQARYVEGTDYGDLIAVFNGSVPGTDLPVQIIVVANTDGYVFEELCVKRIDIGICRIGMSRLRGLDITQEFRRDMTDKTLTAYRSDGRTMKRLENFTAGKFSDWAVQYV